jgi:hypothetical protein
MISLGHVLGRHKTLCCAPCWCLLTLQLLQDDSPPRLGSSVAAELSRIAMPPTTLKGRPVQLGASLCSNHLRSPPSCRRPPLPPQASSVHPCARSACTSAGDAPPSRHISTQRSQQVKPTAATSDKPITADQIYQNALADTIRRMGCSTARVSGQARARHPRFMAFIQAVLDNSTDIGECGSRVLRLKPTLDLDATELEIDMVLDALKYNYRVEALYIHNFEDVRMLHLFALRCWSWSRPRSIVLLFSLHPTGARCP